MEARTLLLVARSSPFQRLEVMVDSSRTDSKTERAANIRESHRYHCGIVVVDVPPYRRRLLVKTTYWLCIAYVCVVALERHPSPIWNPTTDDRVAISK